MQSIGGGIYYYYYFFMEASCDPALRCDAFFVNLNFHCIEHFIYTIVSFVLVCLYLSLHILLFLNAYPSPPPPPSFFFVCVLTLLVFPSSPKVVVMPLTFYRRDFSFFTFYISFLCLVFLLEYKSFHLLLPVFITCRYGMLPTIFHELNVHSTFSTPYFEIAVPNIGSVLFF